MLALSAIDCFVPGLANGLDVAANPFDRVAGGCAKNEPAQYTGRDKFADHRNFSFCPALLCRKNTARLISFN